MGFGARVGTVVLGVVVSACSQGERPDTSSGPMMLDTSHGSSTSESDTGATLPTTGEQTGPPDTSGSTTTSPVGSSTDATAAATEATTTDAAMTTTSGPAAVCGDGVVDGDEECDDGEETPACDANCTTVTCGDGDVNAAAGEQCDDGEATAQCDSDCTSVVCGDGAINAAAGEECDEQDSMPGDLCAADCTATEIVQVTMGAYSTCVRFARGTVRCWGGSADGQLGYGDTNTLGDTPGELPTPDVDVGAKVLQLASAHSHVCAVVEPDGLRCWGLNDDGELGHGNTDDIGDGPGEMPPPDVAIAGVAEVSAGADHTCVRTTDKKVRCWGNAAFGQLGYGETNTYYLPGPELPGLDQIDQISAGGRHTCALRGGQVFCWGGNSVGQLGLGHTNNIGDGPGEMPPAPVDVGGVVTRLTSGDSHTCALMQAGNVRCWGYGPSLGNGNGTSIGDGPGEMPPKNVALGGAAMQVEAGNGITCALLSAGKVKCWGRGMFGALGYGSIEDVGTKPGQMPPQDVSLAGSVGLLGSGHASYISCGVLTDGTLRCWGANDNGQLGLGHKNNVGDDETPAMTATVPF